MVVKKVLCTPIATSSVISLVVNKTFLFDHLFNEDGQGTIELLKGDKLIQAMLVHSLVFPYHLQLHFNG
jgi:hypothetical protein